MTDDEAKAMVKRTYDAAVELFAYLCKAYNLNPLADGGAFLFLGDLTRSSGSAPYKIAIFAVSGGTGFSAGGSILGEGVYIYNNKITWYAPGKIRLTSTDSSSVISGLSSNFVVIRLH